MEALRKQYKHLTNLLRFNRGADIPIMGPIKAEWEVINTCNAKCRTCLHWQEPPDLTLLSTIQGKNMIEQLAESGLFSLSFTGGEPLLRKDLVELLGYAKKQGLATTLISNGLLITERRASELVDVNVDTVFISIDAAQPQLNDELRGIEGYLELALNAIDNLKAMRRNAGPKIFIKATISSKNVQQLVPLAELARVKGIEGLSFQLAQILENTKFVFDKSLLLNKETRQQFLEQLDKLLADYHDVLNGSREYYQSLRQFFENPEALQQYRPVTGFYFVQIDSWGNFYTSPAKNNKIGNILQEPFEIMWYGQKANELRTHRESPPELNYLFDTVGTMSVDFSHLNLKRFVKLALPLISGAKSL